LKSLFLASAWSYPWSLTCEFMFPCCLKPFCIHRDILRALFKDSDEQLPSCESQFKTVEILRGSRPNENNESRVLLQQNFTLTFKRQKDQNWMDFKGFAVLFSGMKERQWEAFRCFFATGSQYLNMFESSDSTATFLSFIVKWIPRLTFYNFSFLTNVCSLKMCLPFPMYGHEELEPCEQVKRFCRSQGVEHR
jgi:hypothetical protein